MRELKELKDSDVTGPQEPGTGRGRNSGSISYLPFLLVSHLSFSLHTDIILAFCGLAPFAPH